jgi:hypothetical protein
MAITAIQRTGGANRATRRASTGHIVPLVKR